MSQFFISGGLSIGASKKEVKLLKKLNEPGVPWGPVVKNLPANAGNTVSIPDLARFHMLWGN